MEDSVVGSLEKVGVIVARFQVANLHVGHMHLIGHVQSQHSDENVLIVLGEHGGQRTENDPLTFNERHEMIRGHFPGRNFIVDRLRDHPWSSDRWSHQLDTLVARYYGEERLVTMYGSRNSFLDVYTGKHSKRYLPAFDKASGSNLRAGIEYSHGMDARSAIIYAQQKRAPIAYSAADIAIYDRAKDRVLLGTKPIFDGKFAFVGGFFDSERDSTDMDTAVRECGEEVKGAVVGKFTQLGERIKVDDPRYRASRDCIVTTLFLTTFHGGNPMPADDISELRWFPLQDLKTDILVPWHKPAAERLLSWRL